MRAHSISLCRPRGRLARITEHKKNVFHLVFLKRLVNFFLVQEIQSACPKRLLSYERCPPDRMNVSQFFVSDRPSR